jgi:ABC-type branched-subunit amino acid transport system substrate-binding protein
VCLLTVCAFALTACGGSALDPKDVAEANAAVSGQVAQNGSGAPVATDSSGNPISTTTTGSQPGSITSHGQTSPNGATNTGTPGSTNQGGNGGGGAPAPATGKGVKVASCTGFKNSTGITDATISIANIADITGPVPGIFTPADQAVKAYAQYFNSTSNICGRKLSVNSYDSQTNTSADEVAAQKACETSFAAVGSMEAFDSGGASTVERCGLPEIHAILTTTERQNCPNCFATEAPGGGYFEDSVPDYFTKHAKAATQHAAMLYPNVAASVTGAEAQIQGEKLRGWKFAYTSSFDIAEFNYGPYVQKLKSTGAQLVQLYGSSDMAIRMAQAFQAADYHPAIYLMNATSYDKEYEAGGSAVEGSIIYVDFTPIAEAASNPELRLYMQWLQQVAPGAQPTYFGMYAWSAARLFVEQAAALGGQLSRANLVKRLRTVHGWTANGLHAPQDVGGKTTPTCWRFLQLHSGTWQPYGGTAYQCGGKVSLK